MPEKVTHPVMVPYGPLAFFEGHLEHTNEVLVQLSSEWFALKTAKHALGTVDRRKQRLRREIDGLDREVRDLEAQRRVVVGEGAAHGIKLNAQDADPDGILDIREPYFEDTDRSHTSGVPGATVTRDADGYLDIREPMNLADESVSEPLVRSTFTSGGVEERPDLARLRELERLEAEDEGSDVDEMAELDDLLDSYERTGMPPPGVATACSDSGSGYDASASDASPQLPVQSPADIYRLMSAADSSSPAGKPASGQRELRDLIEPRQQQSEDQAFAPHFRQSADHPFAGEVREHRSSPAGNSELDAEALKTATAAAPRERVSKFKAERQRAGR